MIVDRQRCVNASRRFHRRRTNIYQTSLNSSPCSSPFWSALAASIWVFTIRPTCSPGGWRVLPGPVRRCAAESLYGAPYLATEVESNSLRSREVTLGTSRYQIPRSGLVQEQLWNAFHNCSAATQTPNPTRESSKRIFIISSSHQFFK